MAKSKMTKILLDELNVPNWASPYELMNAVCGITSFGSDKWKARAFYLARHLRSEQIAHIDTQQKLRSLRDKYSLAYKERQILKDWIRQNTNADPWQILGLPVPSESSVTTNEENSLKFLEA